MGASVSVSVHSWIIRVHDQSRVESGLLRRQPSQDCKTRLHHAHRFSSVEYRARWDSRCSRCIDWPPQYSRHVWIRFLRPIFRDLRVSYSCFFALVKHFYIASLATPLISLCMLTVNDLIPPLHNDHWTLRVEAACRTRF